MFASQNLGTQTEFINTFNAFKSVKIHGSQKFDFQKFIPIDGDILNTFLQHCNLLSLCAI